MKKTSLFIICLAALILVLCSCQAHTSPPTISQPPKVNSFEGYETVLYRTHEDAPIFNRSQTTEFDSYEYIDNNAPQTRSIIILDKEYSLTYLNSAKFALSDIYVHVYTIESIEGSKVLFDTKTDKIVKYSGIPYDEVLQSEAEYTAFIQRLLGEEYNLSEYSYQNTTHYYTIYEYGVDSSVEDGFRIPAENEMIDSYSFYYKKMLGNISTSSHITAEFSIDSDKSPTFMLEVFDFEYSKWNLDKLSDELDIILSCVEVYLKTIVNSKYSIVDIDFTSHMLFEQNGALYLRLNAQISFSTGGSESTTGTLVQTITRIR